MIPLELCETLGDVTKASIIEKIWHTIRCRGKHKWNAVLKARTRGWLLDLNEECEIPFMIYECERCGNRTTMLKGIPP
jgi:hypothetical protein